MRTFQTARTLGRLTVRENVLLAAARQPGERLVETIIRPGRVRRREREAGARADELLALVRLERHANALASTLSGGQRKLLDFARALMTGPRLLLLDEPIAGVNPTLRAQLLEHVIELRERESVTFLLVEHDLDVVMRVSDTVVVMNEGRVIASGLPAAVRSRSPRRRRLPRDAAVSAPLLEVEGLEAGYGDALVLHGVSLRAASGRARVHRRPQRSRQVDAAEDGLRARPAGARAAIRLAGEEIGGRAARPARRAAGLNLVPQLDNVFPSLTIAENLKVGALGRAAERARRCRSSASTTSSRCSASAARQRAGTLSGGQRKLLALARALVTSPRLLLLDEPSAGLAPQAVRARLRQARGDQRSSGSAIVMVEQNARRGARPRPPAATCSIWAATRSRGLRPELLDDPKVAALYLGGSISTSGP